MLPRHVQGMVLLILAALLLLPGLAWGADLTAQEMVQCFVSPDQCGMPLEACPAGMAMQMRDQIAAQVAQGMGREEIISHWVGQYGPWILAAPPKRGFDLVAWSLPGILLLGGTVFLMILLRKRAHRAARPLLAGESNTVAYDEEIDQRVKDYL